MKCLNCSSSFDDNLLKCPYCKMDVNKASLKRLVDEKIISDRIIEINKEFGLISSIKDMNDKELAKFFSSLYEKCQNSEDEASLNQLSIVSEEYNSRLNIRKEITDNLKSTEDVVFDLLDNYDPPEVYAAAFKIRALTERVLKDEYKIPYNNDNEDKIYRFAYPYYDLFKEITKDSKVASKLTKDHSKINLFIHEGKENDEKLQKTFKNKQEQVEFLKNAYNLRKKYNLI